MYACLYKVPQLVRSLKRYNIVSLAAGEYHASAITDSGQMLTWGLGIQYKGYHHI